MMTAAAAGVGAWTVCTEHRPVHVQADAAINPAENGCTSADVDVIRMRAGAKDRKAVARTCKFKSFIQPSPGTPNLLRSQGIVPLTRFCYICDAYE